MLGVMTAPQVDIVVPVRNEERDLAPSVRRLAADLRDSFPFTARITIADNGSTDGTWAIATALAREVPGVRAVHMDLPGRGRALREIWSQSEAEVLAYMDVDLSTDLNALLPLVAPLLSGHSDVAIGTRLARGSRVTRGPKREVISRCYNLLLRTIMGARFSDAQCGFKAMRREAARALLPLTQDTGWFFDTELLVLAERAGLRIHEIPVDWVDDLDSRVDIVATALADLRGMCRLGVGLARGSIQVPELRGSRAGLSRSRHADLPLQIARFTVIGVISTIAYIVLFLLLRGIMSAQAANVISLGVTAVANTAANRRVTFGISGRSNAARHQGKGLVAFGIGLALTAGSLVALMAGSAHPSRITEISVLIAANLVATVLRFVLYRYWVFGGPKRQRDRSTAGRAEDPGDPFRHGSLDPGAPLAALKPAGHVHVSLNATTTSRERTS